MLPAFYGDPPTSFGIIHPHEGAGRSHCLVICQPLFGEAICAHWALRQIAQRASTQGYDVLRFDLSGTGNSMVDPASVSVTDWLADIECAIDHVRQHSGSEHVSIVGARLGFALAAMVSLRRDIEMLIGWDPLLDGHTLLKDRETDIEHHADGSFDCNGYTLSGQIAEELRGLKVRRLDSVRANAVTTSSHTWDHPPAQLGIDVIESGDVWTWSEPIYSLFYAHDSVRLVCEQLS